MKEFFCLLALVPMAMCQAMPESELKAKAVAEKRDILVYYYGSDWCRSGNTIYEKVIQHPDFRQSLESDFVINCCNAKEKQSEDEKNTYQAWGVFKHEPDVYPAVRLFTSEGRCYAMLDGLPHTTSVTGLTEKIKAAKKTFSAITGQWDFAMKQQGDKKIESLVNGILTLEPLSSIGHLNRQENFKHIFDELKKLDPDDKQGWQRRFFFNGMHLSGQVQGFAKEQKWEEGETFVNGWINDSRNTRLLPEQMQQLHLLKFILYKNREGYEDARFTALEKARRINPKSHWGLGSVGWQCMMGRGPVAIPYGWNSSHFKGATFMWDVEVGVDKSFSDEGRFRVTFQYQKGESKVTFKRVALMSGVHTIAEATGTQVLGKENKTVSFVVSLKEKKAPLVLRVEGEVANGTDSSGEISVEPMLPERRAL